MRVWWLACALTLDRWSQNELSSLCYCRAPSYATASFCPCRSNRRIFQGVEALSAFSQFDHYACFSASSPTLLFPRPPPSPLWRNEKLRIKPPTVPKTTLRLTHPKRVARAKGSRKRAWHYDGFSRTSIPLYIQECELVVIT